MQTTTRLEKIQLTGLLKLYVSQPILDKIKYLCRGIAKVEWSGVLFYRITGSISDMEGFSMEVIDIFLMDKGTSGYTEYSYDGDIANFMMDKAMEDPTWMDVKIGHIHSHNTMGVFFSSTDWDELFDNCANHNFYLSLIVNNYMDMIAKLVFRGIPKKIKVPDLYLAKDENGEDYELSLGDEKEIESPPVLFVHDCEILAPSHELTVENWFHERLEEIIKLSDDKAKIKSQSWKKEESYDWKKENGNKTGNGRGNSDHFNRRSSNFPPVGGNNGNIKGLLPAKKHGSEEDRFFNDQSFSQELITEDEKFLCYILRMGDKVEGDNLDATLDEMKLAEITGPILASSIIDNYAAYYDRFFKDIDSVTMDDFLDSIQTAVETLVDYEGKYDFLPDVIKELKDFGLKLETKWKEDLFAPKH